MKYNENLILLSIVGFVALAGIFTMTITASGISKTLSSDQISLSESREDSAGGAFTILPCKTTCSCTNYDQAYVTYSSNVQYYAKGSVAYKSDRATGGYTDTCLSSTQLREYSCSGKLAQYEDIICPSGHTCSNGKCVHPTIDLKCTDSDATNLQTVKGTIAAVSSTVNKFVAEDGCLNNVTLSQVSCNPNNLYTIGDESGYATVEVVSSQSTCQYGCSNGVCLTAPSTNTKTCTDSDGATGYATWSTTFTKADSTAVAISYVDTCVSSTGSSALSSATLREYKCDSSNNAVYTDYACPSGCVQGRCVNPTTDLRCVDSDVSSTSKQNVVGTINGTNSTINKVIFTDSCASTTSVNDFKCTTPYHIITEAGWTFEYAVDVIQCASGTQCVNGACTATVPNECTDREIGTNWEGSPKYFTGLSSAQYVYPGTVTSKLAGATSYTYNVDSCASASSLVEYYCDAQNVSRSTTVSCPNGCLNSNIGGRCINVSTEDRCAESDGGKNFNVYSTINRTTGSNSFTWEQIMPNQQLSDQCLNTTTLIEGFCTGTYYTYYDVMWSFPADTQLYTCPNGCNAGKCI